jgi:HAD superfamily hydrolase (TIGR01509 family)
MKTTRFGLIFDMDGVIADTEGLNVRASVRVFANLFNLTGIKPEDFEAGIGRGAEAYMRLAGEANGLVMSDEDVNRAVEARQVFLLEMLASDPLPAFPGVLPLMNAALASPDWSIAIATGSTKEKTDAVLRSAQVPFEQMVVITGSEPHARKPAPDMFLAAAARLNVAPARCVVIEDAVSGVQAAKAAGARCIAVTNSFDASRLGAADLIVDSLAGVSLATLAGLLAS